MDSRFKLRISRMFRSSFGSCQSRNLSDITENAVFVPQNHRNFQMMDTKTSPKARSFPSICKPICNETEQTVDNDCIITAPPPPRRKVSEKHSPYFVSTSFISGRICPPASPVSPLNRPFHHPKQFDFYDTVKNKKNKKKKKSNKFSTRNNYLFSSSSLDSTNIYGGGWWFSSEEEEEDETNTFFSSRSLSSDDSSESRRRHSRRKKSDSRRRGRATTSKRSEMGVLALKKLEGKVKDSFAVVKSSMDPYSDFRTSMLEMIVERQIFGAKDLEHLLHCFLSLNSHNHHRIIVQVFTEIYEALF